MYCIAGGTLILVQTCLTSPDLEKSTPGPEANLIMDSFFFRSLTNTQFAHKYTCIIYKLCSIPRAFPVKRMCTADQCNFFPRIVSQLEVWLCLGWGLHFFLHTKIHTQDTLSVSLILCYTYSCITITYYIHISTNGALVKLSVILINGLSLSWYYSTSSIINY